MPVGYRSSAPTHVNSAKARGRRFAFGAQLRGIFVAQFVERKIAAFGDFDRALDCIGISREKLRHLSRGFQVMLAIENRNAPRFATVV